MRLLSFVLSSLLVLPVAAHATTLTYTLTPAGGPGVSYSFTTDQNPVTGQQPTDGFFGISPVGTGGFFAGSDTVFFIVPGSGYAGTIQLISSDFSTQIYFDGPQLFSGTPDAPTLLTGNFLLTGLFIPSPTADQTYTVPDGAVLGEDFNLTVTDGLPISAVPEPSSLVLLGSGVLGVAGVVRRRLAS